MKVTLTIDGSTHTGAYRVDCQCGDHWIGKGEAISTIEWSPALPIAEAVMHVRMVHNELPLDVRFTQRFRQWLGHYWESASYRLAAQHKGSTFGAPTQVAR